MPAISNIHTATGVYGYALSSYCSQYSPWTAVSNNVMKEIISSSISKRYKPFVESLSIAANKKLVRIWPTPPPSEAICDQQFMVDAYGQRISDFVKSYQRMILDSLIKLFDDHGRFQVHHYPNEWIFLPEEMASEDIWHANWKLAEMVIDQQTKHGTIIYD